MAQGKFAVGQGKNRENTGNLKIQFEWVPCLKVQNESSRLEITCAINRRCPLLLFCSFGIDDNLHQAQQQEDEEQQLPDTKKSL